METFCRKKNVSRYTFVWNDDVSEDWEISGPPLAKAAVCYFK
jgi:hypothetical protein